MMINSLIIFYNSFYNNLYIYLIILLSFLIILHFEAGLN